jgi:hypothetical protein
MGPLADLVESVVDVVGSVVEFVVDNALPIISTVALNYFAPGLGDFFSISQTAVKAIGGAAISAMNGGSIADIATAGLTPFLPSIGKSLGISLDPTGFINSSIASVLGDNVISSVISNAVGSATMAGVTAAITGGDILKAAGMAGLSSAVGTSLSKTWNAIKEYAPTMSDIENNFKATFAQVEDLIPEYEEYQDSVDVYNKTSQDYNDFIQDEDFVATRDQYQSKYDEYLDARDKFNAGDRSYLDKANSLAAELNGDLGTKMTSLADQAESLFAIQQDATQGVSKFMNDPDFSFKMQAYAPVFNELNSLQTQYDTFTNKIQADYSNFQMSEALAKGDYTNATKYYTDLNNYNQAILKVEPNTTVTTPSLTTQQNTFLQDFSKATDQAVKDQLTSQASQLFADYKAPITTDTTAPTTPTTGTGTGTSTNPYENLPTLPEGGIGQPTPPAPPTGTTGTGTTTGGTNTASNIGNYLTNVGSNVLGNITKGVIGNEVINAILGNDPQRPSLPTKPRPPSKVDVSTLRPFSGNLPSNVTANVTPEKKDPTTLTPLTGGLPTTGGTTTPTTTTPTTPTTNTTTQTPTGGLQSNQTQTPPTKVDVSKLTPVTDTNWLKSLGIA